MDKQRANKGFTVMELLIVILILTVFTFQISTFSIHPSLTIFMEKIMQKSVVSQELAFINKEEVDIDIGISSASFGEEVLEYPSNIACSVTSFHYNEKGNINKAGTVTCSDGNTTKKLIYQLGSGRVRLE